MSVSTDFEFDPSLTVIGAGHSLDMTNIEIIYYTGHIQWSKQQNHLPFKCFGLVMLSQWMFFLPCPFLSFCIEMCILLHFTLSHGTRCNMHILIYANTYEAQTTLCITHLLCQWVHMEQRSIFHIMSEKISGLMLFSSIQIFAQIYCCFRLCTVVDSFFAHRYLYSLCQFCFPPYCK